MQQIINPKRVTQSSGKLISISTNRSQQFLLLLSVSLSSSTMVKLFVLVTILSIVEGSLPTIPGLFRGDPFPKTKSSRAVPHNVQLHTITQRLDNFDLMNEATFEQRFYSNNEFYQRGGPILVFLAGEMKTIKLTQSFNMELKEVVHVVEWQKLRCFWF